MGVPTEMLVMFPQRDHNMKFNRQFLFLVSNPLQLCSVQDSLSPLAIAVEVRREGQGTATFSIVEEKQVGLGGVGEGMPSPNHCLAS